jgi:hypothetical protein
MAEVIDAALEGRRRRGLRNTAVIGDAIFVFTGATETK